jgi:beta-N-acetylhexosaminidase
MTLEQKIGQFFFPAVFINDSEDNIQATERLIRDYNIGGLTFFHSRASAATNYETKKKIVLNDQSFERLKELVIRYQKSATTPLLMSIDAEWGLAMRVEKTPQYPYAITLGALPTDKKNLVYEVGKQIGLDLKSAGIHYNLAPLADINNNPKNPVIGYRSFGENKDKVSDFAVEYLRGMTDAGVLGCLKHFPGHGNTQVDSHLGLPILEENLEQLLANELVPFIKGIEHNVDSIMIGHLAVPALNDGENISATLSKSVIENLLRNQLDFNGLIISDALNMHSVSKLYSVKGQLEWEAFNAGNDILCFAENVPEGIQEILKNASPERIEASYNRILKYKKKVGILSGNTEPVGSFDFYKTSKLNRSIAEHSITKIKGEAINSLLYQAKKESKLAKLSIYKNTDNAFFRSLSKELPSPEYCLTTEDSVVGLEEKITNYDTVIVALFVPKAKPLNNFDIEDKVLILVEKLFETKKCILVVFGNPYVLQLLPKIQYAQGIIQAYQDFDEFQEVAANQLIEDSDYKGILPILLNQRS